MQPIRLCCYALRVDPFSNMILLYYNEGYEKKQEFRLDESVYFQYYSCYMVPVTCLFLSRGVTMNDKHALFSGVLATVILCMLLILTLFTYLSFLTIWFLPLPVMYLGAKFGWRGGVIGLAVSFVLLAGFGMNSLFTLFPIFFFVMGLAMGVAVNYKKSAFAILLSGGLANCAVLIAFLAISVLYFHYNISQEVVTFLTQAYNQAVKEMGSTLNGQDLSMLRAYKETIPDIIYLVPGGIVVVSFSYALIISLISLPILRLFHINAPHWVAFRKWQMPKSILWLYLIVLLARLTNIVGETGTPVNIVTLNFNYALQIALAIQGFSFLFAFAYRRKWPLVMPILLSVVLAILGFTPLEMVTILGIIDLGFDLRGRIPEKK